MRLIGLLPRDINYEEVYLIRCKLRLGCRRYPADRELGRPASITVKDAEGRTVGAARLGPATLVGPYETTAPGYPNSTDAQIRKAPEQVTHGFCAYQLSIAGLPDSAFYRLQFGAQPETTLSRGELEQAGWTWKPTLGVAEDARQETMAWYGNLCVRAAGVGGSC